MLTGFIGRHKVDLPTPCLLLDLAAVERNIRKMAAFFSGSDCELRPHAKTHKSPWIAHRQVSAGAIGIACAKLQDAKAFADAGIQHILVANQVVGQEKIRELLGISLQSEITVCVDQLENAQQISNEARRMGIVLPVLVEIDVGIQRCGVEPGAATVSFVSELVKLKGLSFKGLMGYEGGLFQLDESKKSQECGIRNRRLIETRELLEKAGFEVPVVSAGGSNTYGITGRCPGVTEVQPGSYVTMDTWNARHGIAFEQSISVLATVISRPTRARVIIDAGLKAISTDHGLPSVKSPAGIDFEELNEEHGKMILAEAEADVVIGDRVEIIPSHGCTTVPLYTHYLAVRDDIVMAQLGMVSGGAVY